MIELLLLIPTLTVDVQQGHPIDATLVPGYTPAPSAPQGTLPGARATSASDDFNRPNSTAMGPDWTEIVGDIEVSNNMGHGVTSGSLMTHVSANAPYDTSLQRVYFESQTPAVIYVASVMGLASSTDNIFLKVQDNNSDGLFDRVFFYRGNNGGSWGAPTYYFDLAVPTSSGTMTTYFTGAGDVAVIEIDNDTSGTVEVFQASGIVAAGLALGNGFGIGTYGSAWFDDYEVNPSTGPEVAVTGTCPGVIGADMSGLTAGGNYALVAGFAGSLVIPGNRPCAGSVLGLDPMVVPGGPLIWIGPADGNGDANIPALGNASPAACAFAMLQLIDLTSCELSPVVGL